LLSNLTLFPQSWQMLVFLEQAKKSLHDKKYVYYTDKVIEIKKIYPAMVSAKNEAEAYYTKGYAYQEMKRWRDSIRC
jgi:hypothetical protein